MATACITSATATTTVSVFCGTSKKWDIKIICAESAHERCAHHHLLYECVDRASDHNYNNLGRMHTGVHFWRRSVYLGSDHLHLHDTRFVLSTVCLGILNSAGNTTTITVPFTATIASTETETLTLVRIVLCGCWNSISWDYIVRLLMLCDRKRLQQAHRLQAQLEPWPWPRPRFFVLRLRDDTRSNHLYFRNTGYPPERRRLSGYGDIYQSSTSVDRLRPVHPFWAGSSEQ